MKIPFPVREKKALLLLPLILVLVLLFAGIRTDSEKKPALRTELTLSVPAIRLYPGDRTALEFTAGPDSPLTFASSNPEVASVDASGCVTAHSPGSALISLSDGQDTVTRQVTVLKKDPVVTHDTAVLTTGNSRVFLPGRSGLQWSSSQPEIADVDQYGAVTAAAPGTAEICAQGEDLVAYLQVTVTDDMAPGCFRFAGEGAFSLAPGFSADAPMDGDCHSPLCWFSSDPAVARVEDGLVTAVSSGTCLITVSDGVTTFSLPLTVGYSVASRIQGLTLAGEHIFLYDVTDDCLLFSKGELDDTLYVASLTKLFTGYVALQYLPEDAMVTPGEELDFCPADGSMAGLKKWVSLSVPDLFAGLMLRSGNDAAQTMAAETGRILAGDPSLNAADAVALFMEEVNRQAALLGLTETHFVTPDGYDAPGHKSSMRDMIRICKLALETPLIRDICSYRSYPASFSDGTRVDWETFVDLQLPDSPFYCPYATGMKTGTTTLAGRCLAASVEFDGKTYLIGSFGCKRSDDRFTDALILLEQYVFQPQS